MTTPHPTRSKRTTPAPDDGPRPHLRLDGPYTPEEVLARAAGREAPAGDTAPPEGTVHRWSLSADVPPAAWASLLVDLRVLLALAAQRRIVLAGPTGTGAPVLDADRIALAVKVGAKSFSSPFVFTRTAGDGEAITTLGDAYDALVLAALTRAGQHAGALLTVSTEASPKAVAASGRLIDVLFGEADRAVTGRDPLAPRAQVEQLVGSLLDTIEDQPQPTGDPVDAILARLIDDLATARAGRSDA